MPDFFTDSGPLVWMDFICKRTKQKPDIAVRLVEITLFEFFDDDIALHLETLFRKSETHHAVALEPETCFEIIGRKSEIVICDVIIRECIVITAGKLKRSIIIGNIYGASEHKVFEEVCETG